MGEEKEEDDEEDEEAEETLCHQSLCGEMRTVKQLVRGEQRNSLWRLVSL